MFLLGFYIMYLSADNIISRKDNSTAERVYTEPSAAASVVPRKWEHNKWICNNFFYILTLFWRDSEAADVRRLTM